MRGAGPEATPVASGTATATLILLLYLPLTPFAAHRFVELNVSLRRRIYRCFDASVDGLVPPDGRNFYRDDFDVALLPATLILLHHFFCGSRSTPLIHEEPELSGADGPVSIWSCKL